MSRLDDLLLMAGDTQKVIALVSRDKRLLRLELKLPPAMTTWRLAVLDAVKAEQWLLSVALAKTVTPAVPAR